MDPKDPKHITDETKILGRRPKSSSPPPRSDDEDRTKPTKKVNDPSSDRTPVEEDPTVILPENDPGRTPQPIDEDTSGHTVLMSPGRRSKPSTDSSAKGETAKSEPEVEKQSGMSDPVVGFLVVVKGPGKGNFGRLGHGQNALGREEGRILIKLVHRQTGETMYELIKEYRSGWKAFWYNTTANLFEISLKEEYNPFEIKEDYLIEDILERSFQENKLERQNPAFPIDYLDLKSHWNKKTVNN